MSEKLYFFNKEGDYLNFQYNETSERYEGDILFHENSTDTYKTFGLYTMEFIPSFEYENVGELTTRKFQLFNDFGIHFYGAKYQNQIVTLIEPVNNDPDFYSKWIMGDNFEVKFPIGTIIKFDQPFLEFNNIDRTYVVVSTKKNGIMIISQMDNATFENSYFSIYDNPVTFGALSISGVNSVGVYNYIDNSYNNNLSPWSEPDFYDFIYVGKKLNVVNSNKNNETLTINNVDLTDIRHFEYSVNKSNLPDFSNLIIEVITRTDVPLLYNESITITSDNKIFINPLLYPQILKPGVEFKIIGSVNNTNFFTVAPMINFDEIVSPTFFATQSHVIYNNLIWECVQAYTQSFGLGTGSTYWVTPEDTQYWSSPTHIKVEQSTNADSLLIGQIYLTSDRYYFEQSWTASSGNTLALASEKFKNDLDIFNIDLFYLNNNLKADLIYPSKYAEVNFYHTNIGPTYSIGSIQETYEKLIGVRDQLDYELNYDYSENFRYNIVFTDLDQFGFKITINGMVYDIETQFVYSGTTIDMERTIDRTLRRWLSTYYVRLFTLGIVTELRYIGNFTSIFYNSIRFTTEYPNVPMNLDNVQIGTTGAYYIEHSTVLFNDLGGFLNIRINDRDYGISTVGGTSSPNIPQTLQNWINEYSEVLIEFDIIVTNINNLLKFDVLSLQRRLDYTISTGKVNLPGIQDFIITNKTKGNFGVLLASNEIILPTTSSDSFEESGFATGMVVSINNTFYPWNNQEYVIDFLDPQVINLSYQGPFWGLTDSICNSSAFITLAFDTGFGQTGCPTPPSPTATGGPFDLLEFDTLQFSFVNATNTYTTNTYNYSSFPGTTGLVDIKYIQLSSSILLFGDNLVSIDAFFGDYLTTVNLPGNTQSIEMEFNTINNYVYCLSKYNLYVVDPVINSLISTISLTASNSIAEAFDIEINPINGDVYVTYENLPRVDIFSFNNLTSNPTVTLGLSTPNFPPTTRTGKMVFNDFEGDMYITTDSEVIRVNTTRDIQTTYGIPGLTHSIFYEPALESIYVYGSNLFRIDNGSIQSITGISTFGFNDIIFNNITSEMNVSNSSGDFVKLSLFDNTFTSTNQTQFGYLVVNQFDGDVYMSVQTNTPFGSIKIINPNNGSVIDNITGIGDPTTKIIYNPERKSIWAIQPTSNSVVEIEVDLGGMIVMNQGTFSLIEDNNYGTLDPNYEPRPSIWLKTREYFRRPRANFEGDVSVQYYWKWLTDEVPQFFLYDFSGEQLPETGSLAYTGPKPLTNAVLNKNPNRDITKIKYPEYQQTIFPKVEWTLSYIDDEDDTSIAPRALELFIGYKDEDEGSLRSVLQLYRKEEIEFSINSDINTNLTFDNIIIDDIQRGRISINENSPTVFTGRGLKSGQHLVIYIKDDSNSKNQYTSENNAILVKIKDVFTKQLILDFFNPDVDFLTEENTVISNYPKFGNTTYLKVTIKVKDKEIARLITYGQTEEEDIRYKIELGNHGKLIAPDEVFIFKEYDINEGGIDWTFLNKKRKEMLMNKDVIYPYIGSYKSLINAINYFGYNDLQLNEYYRNTNSGSKLFGQLFKVEIPDIFNNTVKGWSEKDFLKYTLPNPNYEETNLFNLTYFITDKEGNYILNYSLDEIIIKLQGLKYWLKRNIIPLTHKILDIMGQTYLNSSTTIKHQTYDVSIFNIRQEMTPVTFKMNETYLYPVNSGSTVYNCVLDFYSIIPGASPKPLNEFIEDPKPDPYATLVLPDYFNINIRTYKTYKEWAPFVTYDIGDKVIYFDKVYESKNNNNRTNNPKKYESAGQWSANSTYAPSSIVEWEREYYVFSGLGGTASITPNLDPQNWLNVTEWKQINLEPVQTINEWRGGGTQSLLPFNFTVDSNIDPFIVIEVTSDNGFGQIYRDRKNYYLKGLKDLTETYSYIDPIGPFTPITPIF
jgi:hypothetical protein